jgi:DNA-binding transcriptional LysR family regulator
MPPARRRPGLRCAMELRQLRYFLAVAEERRFSTAARRLHIAAPSLSQQIRALERDLRVTLFDRTPHGAELTPAGRLLAERARVVLAEVDRARDDVRSAGHEHREQVQLRVCTMAEHVLDGPLRLVGTSVSGVEAVVTSSPGDAAVEAVRQSRADAAVVWSRPPAHRDLPGLVLGSVSFGVALPAGHPLADRSEVGVAELAHEQVVMFPRPPFAGIWQRTVDHLLPRGAGRDQVVVEPDLINGPEAMLRSVANGGGVAPVILGVAELMDVDGVVVRPLDPALSLDLEVVWRRSPRPAVLRVVDQLVGTVGEPGVLMGPPHHPQGSSRGR